MVFGFGRKQRGATARLASGKWRCADCGEEHGWPFDLAASAPNAWPHEVEYAPNSMLRTHADFLSEDFCVLDGEHFMIRAVLPVPVIGLNHRFAFGCWSTLSRENFDKYVDGFDSGEYVDMGPWSGWLMNRLRGFGEDPDPIAVHVQPLAGRQRPELWVMDESHPLSDAQQHGITAERMLEIFAEYGHAPG